MILTNQHIKFKTTRSSGPGGSRANRRSTRVQVWVRVKDLPITEAQKKMLRVKIAHHINHDDEIEAWCDSERAQIDNRRIAMKHLNDLIEDALIVPKTRIPTEIPRSAENRRIHDKKMQGAKKGIRHISKAGQI